MPVAYVLLCQRPMTVRRGAVWKRPVRRTTALKHLPLDAEQSLKPNPTHR